MHHGQASMVTSNALAAMKGTNTKQHMHHVVLFNRNICNRQVRDKVQGRSAEGLGFHLDDKVLEAGWGWRSALWGTAHHHTVL